MNSEPLDPLGDALDWTRLISGIDGIWLGCANITASLFGSWDTDNCELSAWKARFCAATFDADWSTPAKDALEAIEVDAVCNFQIKIKKNLYLENSKKKIKIVNESSTK